MISLNIGLCCNRCLYLNFSCKGDACEITDPCGALRYGYGQDDRQLFLARKMKNAGLSIEQIINLTGLSKTDIEEL